MAWQILQRNGGSFRRRAVRGEEYDGARWVLRKSYATEADARKAIAILEARYWLPSGRKSMQFKLIEKR